MYQCVRTWMCVMRVSAFLNLNEMTCTYDLYGSMCIVLSYFVFCSQLKLDMLYVNETEQTLVNCHMTGSNM